MANKFVTPVGKLAWSAIIDQTRNLKDELEWNCGFILPEEQSQGIVEHIETALKLHREKDSSFPKDNSGLNFPFSQSMKKDETGKKVPEVGMLMFKFKRPATILRKATGNREANTPPLIFDSLGRPVSGLPRIGPGSLGKAIYDPFVYDKAGQRGVRLTLLGFQITKLEVDTIELEAVEGGWVPDQAPSALDAMLNGGYSPDSDGEAVPY
jgi:hypothetical protein